MHFKSEILLRTIVSQYVKIAKYTNWSRKDVKLLRINMFTCSLVFHYKYKFHSSININPKLKNNYKQIKTIISAECIQNKDKFYLKIFNSTLEPLVKGNTTAVFLGVFLKFQCSMAILQIPCGETKVCFLHFLIE